MKPRFKLPVPIWTRWPLDQPRESLEEKLSSEEQHDSTIEEINAKHKEISQNIRQITLVIITFSLFCILTLAQPDSAFFDQAIKIPFAGVAVSFTGFLIFAPAILITLTIALHIYVQYWLSLEHFRSHGIIRIPTLFNINHSFSRLINIIAFYMLTPGVLFMFGYRSMTESYFGPSLLFVAYVVLVVMLWLVVIRFGPELEKVRRRRRRLVAALGVATSAALAVAAVRSPELFYRPYQVPGIDLKGSDLSERDLHGADLSRAQLSDTILHRANLETANLSEATLKGSNLQHANLRRAILVGANLERAFLRGARLDNARILEATMNGARLPFATLRECVLTGAKLTEADLRKADLGRADLGKATLRRARLQGARLFLARLHDADLGHANLSGADLRGAKLVGADIDGTIFNGAILDRADLSDVRNLDRQQLELACLAKPNRKPILPFPVDLQQCESKVGTP